MKGPTRRLEISLNSVYANCRTFSFDLSLSKESVSYLLFVSNLEEVIVIVSKS